MRIHINAMVVGIYSFLMVYGGQSIWENLFFDDVHTMLYATNNQVS